MGKIDLRDKRILVTGGNGYLGAHLVSTLRDLKANVFVMDMMASGDKTHAENEFITDITNREMIVKAVKEIQPNIVFHLAASLNRARNFDGFDVTNKVNHDGTYNLLEALKDIEYDQLIFTSTSEIYGANKAPFYEEQLPDPASPYSLTKVYAENLIKTYSKTYDKKYTILRLFNFFGKDMSDKFFIPQMIASLKNNSSFGMTEGEQKRDFLYIDDVINAMVLSVTNSTQQNEIYNVCSGVAVSLRELVLTSKDKLKSDCRIDFGALDYRENEVWNMVGNNDKIKKDLGFEPKYNLEGAIGMMIG